MDLQTKNLRGIGNRTIHCEHGDLAFRHRQTETAFTAAFRGPDNYFPPFPGRASGLSGQCGIAFDWIYLPKLQEDLTSSYANSILS